MSDRSPASGAAAAWSASRGRLSLHERGTRERARVKPDSELTLDPNASSNPLMAIWLAGPAPPAGVRHGSRGELAAAAASRADPHNLCNDEHWKRSGLLLQVTFGSIYVP